MGLFSALPCVEHSQNNYNNGVNGILGVIVKLLTVFVIFLSFVLSTQCVLAIDFGKLDGKSIFGHCNEAFSLRDDFADKKEREKFQDAWVDNRDKPEVGFLYGLTVRDETWRLFVWKMLAQKFPNSAFGPLGSYLDDDICPWYGEAKPFHQLHCSNEGEKHKSLVEALKREPDNPLVLFVLANVMDSKDEAGKDKKRKVAERLVKAAPDVSVAHCVFAESLSCSIGAAFSGEFEERDLVLSSLQKAIELDSGWIGDYGLLETKVHYAVLSAVAKSGQWGGKGAHVDEALVLLRNLIEKHDLAEAKSGLLEVLQRTGKYSQVIEEAERLYPEDVDPPFYDEAVAYLSVSGQPTIIEREGEFLRLTLPYIRWQTEHPYLIGDFNKWQCGKTLLVRDEAGRWTAKIKVGAGYQKYMVSYEGTRYGRSDLGALDFYENHSAFYVKENGEVARQPKDEFLYHLNKSRALPRSESFYVEPECNAISEAEKAYRLCPKEFSALKRLLCSYGKKERQAKFSPAYEAFHCLIHSYRIRCDKELREKIELAKKEIKSPFLDLHEALLVGEAVERKDKVIAALREEPLLAGECFSKVTQICTSEAEVEAIGKLADEVKRVQIRNLHNHMLNEAREYDKRLASSRKLVEEYPERGFNSWDKLIYAYRDVLSAAAKDEKKDELALQRGMYGVYRSALRELPYERDLVVRLTRSYYRSDEYEQWLQFLEELHLKHKDSVALTVFLAKCHSENGNEEIATKLFKEALEPHVKWEEAYTFYVEHLLKYREFSTAKEVLLRARKAYPYSDDFTVKLIKVYEELGEIQRVKKLFEELIREDSKISGDIRRRAIRFYTNEGDDAEKAYWFAKREFESISDSKGEDKADAAIKYLAKASAAGHTIDSHGACRHLMNKPFILFFVVFSTMILFGGVACFVSILWVAFRKYPLATALAVPILILLFQVIVNSFLAIVTSCLLHDTFLELLGMSENATNFFVMSATHVVTVFGVFLLLMFAFYMRNEGLSTLGLKRLPSKVEIAKGIIGGLLLIVLQRVITHLFVITMGGLPEGMFGSQGLHRLGRLMHYSRFGLLVILVDIVILAPIVEEIFFRGYIYRRWCDTMGGKLALILSSVAFAVIHGAMILHIFFVAVVLCKLYDNSKGLWAPIIAHGVMNLFALAMNYLWVC